MDGVIQYLKSEATYPAVIVDCYAFRRGRDVIEGRSVAVGNMVSGFPFEVEGVPFHNSEAAYIAGAFGSDSLEHIGLQRELMAERNGFMAKKRIRRFNEHLMRKDWGEYNVMWMLYVVWCKVVGNSDFRELLLALPPQSVIIEDSTFHKGSTATFWGTKNKMLYGMHRTLDKELKEEGMSKCARKKVLDAKRLAEWRKMGCFEGCNVMGKILMLCRDALLEGTVPSIDLELLRSKNIHLLGRRLDFDLIPSIAYAQGA